MRRPRSTLVRPNVPDATPEIFAHHRAINAATAVASTTHAWQLDHAASHQTQETRGFKLLRHPVPVSGDDELTPLLQQQTRDLAEFGHVFRATGIGSRRHVRRKVNVRSSHGFDHACNPIMAPPFDLMVISIRNLCWLQRAARGHQHTTMRALYRIARRWRSGKERPPFLARQKSFNTRIAHAIGAIRISLHGFDHEMKRKQRIKERGERGDTRDRGDRGERGEKRRKKEKK